MDTAASGAVGGTDTHGKLAAHVYRAMLMLMPASVHLWFSDLRDRSICQQLEAYTVSSESPSLLQHEISELQVRPGVRTQLSIDAGQVCPDAGMIRRAWAD